MSRLKNAMAIVAICISALFAGQFSGTRGDLWTGGSFSYMSVGASGGDRENIVTLCPTLRFFPVSGFCLGPRMSWMGEFIGSSSQNIFGVGMDIGYAHGTSIIPYILSSPHFAFVNSSYNYFGSSSSSDQVFFLPFTGGIIVPVGKNLGIQFELGYSMGFDMSSNQSPNVFSIGIGICGLGEKLAVSVVNTFNLMTSAF